MQTLNAITLLPRDNNQSEPKHVDICKFSPILTDAQMKSQEGSFFNRQHYPHFLDSDCDVYGSTADGYVLLFSLRKNVIPTELSNIAKQSFTSARSTSTTNRGIASGKVNLKHMSSNIIKLLEPNGFKSRVQYKNGKVSTYKVSNRVKSMIAGYYDKRHGNNFNYDKGRETAFTRDKKEKWSKFIPVVEYIDKMYKSINPAKHAWQHNLIDHKYTISSTIFSTITINYNFRTAAHCDSGDIHNGYSAFFVCEEGNWSGCYLGYPQFGVCANVRQGDVLIMNPHQYHCNTAFENLTKDDMRLSFVLYCRNGFRSD